MNNSASASRRTWNRVMNALVWASAVLVIVLVAGILGMVLVRGIPHISWKFLEQAGLEAQCLGKHQHTHQTVNDTGDARQRLVGELDHRDDLAVLGVLGQVNGRAHTQRQYDQKRQQDDIQRVEDRRQDAVFAQTLGFQTCLLSGSLTLVIMNLPTIIRTTQESLKTVPQGYREGALGLGAGKWHIIRTIVLPCSIDGIVTGCILAVGRIVGESAALLFTAGAAEVIANGVLKA